MDNLTHSLIGVLVGRSVVALRARRDPARATERAGEPASSAPGAAAVAPALAAAIVFAAVIGNNLPDIDFVLRYVLADPRLAYLVHHRGFTHSIGLLPVLGPLAAIAGAWLARVRPFTLSRRDQLWLLGTGILSVILHIAADSCNEYGVHPFWPFDDHWFYGDFIFIMEPVILLALLPFAAATARSRAGRWISVALEVVVLGLVVGVALVPPFAKLWLFAWAAIFAIWQRRRPGLVGAWSGVLVGGLIFGVCAGIARDRVMEQLRVAAPDERVLQFASSPGPGNPLLWRVVLATLDGAGTYRARIGVVSLWRYAFSPFNVPGMDFETTAPLGQSRVGMSPWIAWKGEYARPYAELGLLSQKYCRFYSLLRFTRVPFWIEDAAEHGLTAGDLRYDREPGPGFTEFTFETGEPCLPSDPPWQPPIQNKLAKTSQ